MRRASIIAALGLAALAGQARADEPPGVCTWGGTPLDTTGVATVTPGLSNARPATEPLHLIATGPLGGVNCSGTMTFDGIIFPGAQCRLFFEYGAVTGMPGVAWFFGQGGAVGTGFLYGADGKLVGAYQPQVISELAELLPQCLTPEGITRAEFSATVELAPRASG